MEKNMSSLSSLSDLIGPLKKLAKTSRAELGGVACYIVKNGAIVSSGVNYNPTGEAMEELIDGKLVSKPEVIHAEIATFQAAAANGIDLSGATLLLNMSPCINCAREITKTDIREVKYLYEWWDKAGLNILHEAGISTEQLKEER
jgi:dCMP deaminase